MGSPCRGLVPHMLRTPMFQRFLFFVALASLFEFFFICCVVFSIVLFLSFVHRILDPKTSCILAVLAHSGASSLGTVRLQGSPWETPWPTWWETWGPICCAHSCFSVSHCSLLNGSSGGPWDVLGGACGVPRASWSVLGPSLGLLGDPWRHLGGPWLLLGFPWATSCGSWGVLGRLLVGT